MWARVAALAAVSATNVSATRAVRRMAGIIALVCLAASPAAASPIAWRFEGTTETLSGNLGPIFPTGSTVTFKLFYDTDMTCVPGDPGTFQFGSSTPTSAFGYSVEIAGHEYSWSQRGNVFLRVQPDHLWFDTSLSGITMDGAPVGSAQQWWPVAFDFTIPGSFAAGTLPTTLPTSLTGSHFDFYLTSFGSNCPGCGANGRLGGSFNSASQIPTPSTLALVGLGFAGLAAWRRRRAE